MIPTGVRLIDEWRRTKSFVRYYFCGDVPLKKRCPTWPNLTPARNPSTPVLAITEEKRTFANDIVSCCVSYSATDQKVRRSHSFTPAVETIWKKLVSLALCLTRLDRLVDDSVPIMNQMGSAFFWRIRYRLAVSVAPSQEIFRAYMKTVTANRSNVRWSQRNDA